MAEQEKRIAKLELILQSFINLNFHYHKTETLTEYLAFVHQSLDKLMYAKNLYLALFDSLEQTIQFVYNVDEVDETTDPNRKFPLASSEQSPTAWVIRNNKKLLMTAAQDKERSAANSDWGTGERAQYWLGMPLISQQGVCLGALVIQSYDANISYSDEDQNIFNIFASVVSNILEKHNQTLQLESTISERNNSLVKQLLEKEKAEKLQQAIFEISSLKHGELALVDLYPRIHQIIDKLLYAKNFLILLFDEDMSELTISYAVDEKDGDKYQNTTIPLGTGLSSYVINTRTPQRLTPALVSELVNQGEKIGTYGAEDFVSWLGAPMISTNMLHGLIVVQSYDGKIIYTDNDLKILNFFAQHVAGAIEATVNTVQRRESQVKLAKHHRLLEQQNTQLSDAYKKLQATQKELIQKEKMASLGGLVAGIAHEINTPLGICVTGVSHLMEETRIFSQSVEKKSLTEAQLNEFLQEVEEIGRILTTNTDRAANLIHSFKQIAVDQSSNEIRNFNMKSYLDEIILSLRPTLKRTSHEIKIKCEDSFWISTHAGALSQIISNLIMNSVKHGFEKIAQGVINIEVVEQRQFAILRFSDNGCGLNEQDMKKLFDPFFTTKRGEGGSGLGTHLVFNLVTTSLKGKLKASSELGKGLAYIIRFPKKLES
ncbi:MAG: ATP-binding protein [Colwellia sp.]|nr:ATP-binding protein [Colwellia sp.]